MPQSAQGSRVPWKWRFAALVVAVLAIAGNPGAVAGFFLAEWHGLGTIACTLAPAVCKDGQPHLELPQAEYVKAEP